MAEYQSTEELDFVLIEELAKKHLAVNGEFFSAYKRFDFDNQEFPMEYYLLLSLPIQVQRILGLQNSLEQKKIEQNA